MTQSFVTQSKQSITLDTRLGGGGEGEVWAIRESGDLVAKIYHPDKRTPERQGKLLAMVQNPPADEMRGAYNHVSLCWPIDLLYAGGHFAGFLMPRIGKSPTVLEVYNPTLRAKTYPGFNWKYLLRTGQNFAIALGALHRKGYIMGDVNESNILVSDQALVTLIDTDSYQVTDSLGWTCRCPVGKPLYTPPELQGTDLKTVDRKPEHDYFGLGVLLFYLLMEGFHPFNGVMQTQTSIGRIEEYCIKQGAFPYRRNGVVAPNPNAPPFDMLPEKIRQLFERCFVEGHRDPGQRPTPEDWHRALEEAGDSLQQCTRDPQHVYSQHLRSCPWCHRETQFAGGRSQPRHSADGLQQPLPPVQPRGAPYGAHSRTDWDTRTVMAPAAIGAAIGLAVAAVTYGLFSSPDSAGRLAGWGAGIAIGVTVLTVSGAAVVFSLLRNSQINRSQARAGCAIVGLGLILAWVAQCFVGSSVSGFLRSYAPSATWLFVVFGLVGLLMGMAIAGIRARRHLKAGAPARYWALAMTVILAILASTCLFAGILGLPFRKRGPETPAAATETRIPGSFSHDLEATSTTRAASAQPAAGDEAAP